MLTCRFYLTIGVIVSLLVALQAARAMVDKRVEFFREAGSGNNISAYFIALNITTMIEYMLQMSLVAAVVFWLRNTLTNYSVFFVFFGLLAWTSSAWSFFFAGFIPPQNLSVTIGFFVTFSGLIFGGGLPPFDYGFIYECTFNRQHEAPIIIFNHWRNVRLHRSFTTILRSHLTYPIHDFYIANFCS